MAGKWKLFRRRGRLMRRLAERGRDYDGSRWELYKTYADEQTAREALALHEARNTTSGGLKVKQFRLEPPAS